MDCVVKDNCNHSFECDFCMPGYKDYSPTDKRILSPAQLERKDERKRNKKERKNSEASKRGRRNKRAGRYSESALLKLYLGWGLDARKIPLSGALKCEGLDSDLRVTILGKERKNENKRRKDLNRLYKLVSPYKAIYIHDFCYIMDEKTFHDLVVLGINPEVEEIEDKRFTYLHNWFDQDKAEIVSCTSNYKPFIFAVDISLWNELSNA